MKTEAARKVTLKIGGQETHENLKNTRRTLCVLQQAATDKENLVGRSRPEKSIKLSSEIIKHTTFSDKGVQTDAVVTAADLTSDDPGVDYWRRLAEKRAEDLDNSFRENEKLKADIEALQEENKICKAMLEESTTLVEILKEELLDKDDDEGAGEAEADEPEEH
ncbi:geminin [Coccinella septempunctata]|uniref:geminin n=1 Tax=Coccinella septempunctata TaxID=41139 RepID=UPI001D06FE41|nr:geminin [Coccinella septempunctata]